MTHLSLKQKDKYCSKTDTEIWLSTSIHIEVAGQHGSQVSLPIARCILSA